jgi:hypothetical protein
MSKTNAQQQRDYRQDLVAQIAILALQAKSGFFSRLDGKSTLNTAL